MARSSGLVIGPNYLVKQRCVIVFERHVTPYLRSDSRCLYLDDYMNVIADALGVECSRYEVLIKSYFNVWGGTEGKD